MDNKSKCELIITETATLNKLFVCFVYQIEIYWYEYCKPQGRKTSTTIRIYTLKTSNFHPPITKHSTRKITEISETNQSCLHNRKI